MKHCSQRNCWKDRSESVWGAGEKEWERKWDWQEVWRRWNKRGDAIRTGAVEREGWKNGREGNTGKCSGSFCPCGAEELPSFGKTSWVPLAHFFLFLSASCTSLLSSLSVLCPPRLLSVSMFYRSLLPSVCLSTSLTPSPHIFRWPLLSAFLLHCVQLVFSQDASLQVLLHQNGTETNRKWQWWRCWLVARLQVEKRLNRCSFLLCLKWTSGFSLTWRYP